MLAAWAILQAMLQGILQAAGPIGYYYKVLTGRFVSGSSFLGPCFWRFVAGRFVTGLLFWAFRFWIFVPNIFVSAILVSGIFIFSVLVPGVRVLGVTSFGHCLSWALLIMALEFLGCRDS